MRFPIFAKAKFNVDLKKVPMHKYMVETRIRYILNDICLVARSIYLLLFPVLASAQEYQLVWSDEFTDSISLDWTYDIGGHGWGNNELQYYTPNNTSVEGGVLKITVKKENIGNNKYTSSRLKTKGAKSWKYGRIEARIKINQVEGNFPAFWMLGESFNGFNWPECGEIDIMEQINKEDIIHANVHYDNNGYRSSSKSLNCDVGVFHVYGIDWDERSIRFFLDGVPYHEVNILDGINGTDEFHKKHFILLNYAMGGNWPGFDVDESALPSSLEVDYVRVYQKNVSTSLTYDFNNEIKWYPNPVKDVLYIDCNTPGINIFEIYSATGVKQLSHNFSGGNTGTININHLKPGMYYLINRALGYSGRFIIAN